MASVGNRRCCYMTSLSGHADFGFFAWARVYQTVGLPLLFIPITLGVLYRAAAGKTGEASSLINVARNLGGSIGISLANTELAQRVQFHQSRLAEQIAPSSLNYQHWSERITAYFTQEGYGAAQAKARALGWIGRPSSRRRRSCPTSTCSGERPYLPP